MGERGKRTTVAKQRQILGALPEGRRGRQSDLRANAAHLRRAMFGSGSAMFGSASAAASAPAFGAAGAFGGE